MPIGRINGAGGSSPEEMFRNLPPVSKVVIVTMVGTMFSVALGICSPFEYALDWNLVWRKFHVWRLFTSGLCAGMPGFSSLMKMFSIGMFSLRYEADGFNTGSGGGSADFAFMLIFGFVVIESSLLLLFYKPYMLFSQALMFYICYVWSRKHPTMSVSFWGVPVQAIFVPWVMVAMEMLLGGSIFQSLLGIAVGHLFYFLVDVLPDLHDIDLLRTPKFLVDMLGWGGAGGATGVHVQRAPGAMPAPGAVQPPRDIPRTGRPVNWGGGGRTLGSS